VTFFFSLGVIVGDSIFFFLLHSKKGTCVGITYGVWRYINLLLHSIFCSTPVKKQNFFSECDMCVSMHSKKRTRAETLKIRIICMYVFYKFTCK